MLPDLYQRLSDRRIGVATNLILDRIDRRTATFQDRYSRTARVFENLDSIILSTGNVVRDELYHALKGAKPQIYAVGDSVAPRRIDDAILDGERVGWMI
jgi:hypothetical protein